MNGDLHCVRTWGQDKLELRSHNWQAKLCYWIRFLLQPILIQPWQSTYMLTLPIKLRRHESYIPDVASGQLLLFIYCYCYYYVFVEFSRMSYPVIIARNQTTAPSSVIELILIMLSLRWILPRFSHFSPRIVNTVRKIPLMRNSTILHSFLLFFLRQKLRWKVLK